MRKTINCFIPYEENTAIDKVVTALKDSIVVNKIYLLTTAHGSMPSVPAGCEPFTIDSLNSSDTIKNTMTMYTSRFRIYFPIYLWPPNYKITSKRMKAFILIS